LMIGVDDSKTTGLEAVQLEIGLGSGKQ